VISTAGMVYALAGLLVAAYMWRHRPPTIAPGFHNLGMAILFGLLWPVTLAWWAFGPIDKGPRG
jgi:hypothetical protein